MHGPLHVANSDVCQHFAIRTLVRPAKSPRKVDTGSTRTRIASGHFCGDGSRYGQRACAISGALYAGDVGSCVCQEQEGLPLAKEFSFIRGNDRIEALTSRSDIAEGVAQIVVTWRKPTGPTPWT